MLKYLDLNSKTLYLLSVGFLWGVLFCRPAQAAGLPTTSEAVSNSSGRSWLQSSQKTSFLPVHEAFQLKAKRQQQRLTLVWTIAPEHYLYQARITLSLEDANGITLSALHYSPSEAYKDEYFGDVEIFRDKAEVNATIYAPSDRLAAGLALKVRYQGCADAGLCYPPEEAYFFLTPSADWQQSSNRKIE